MLDRLRMLFDHAAWADDLALSALRSAGEGPDTTAARQLLAHILGAEHVWLRRLEGVKPEVAVWPELSLDQCARLAEANREGYRALLDRVDPEALSRPVHYTNSAGDQFDSRRDDILLHVALHGSYHRGQVAARIRSAGAQPNPTDYIAFVRGAPAATRR